MIDGFSILLPTYNMLPWLKICIRSLQKNSKLNNELCIHVDGSTDETTHWLTSQGIPYSVDKHKGMYSAWNKAGEHAAKSWVFLGEDDFYFCPDWDINLARWIDEVGDKVRVVAKCIEPFLGSFPPIVDCGRTPEEFNEEKLLEWVESNSRHELVNEPFGMLSIPLKVWREIGGYDTNYDPTGVGSGDLKMKLHKHSPNLVVKRALDVLIYHFKPCPDVIPYPPLVDHSSVSKNIMYFTKKWGVTPEEAEKIYGRK